MNYVIPMTPVRFTPWLRSSRSLLSIIVMLVLAYGLDRWIDASRRTAADTFQFMPVAWTMTAANLIFAAALLVVIRELHLPHAHARIVRSLCLLVGLVPTLLPVVYFSDLAIRVPSQLAAVTAPTTHVGMASAFLVVLGGYTLLRFRKSGT